jgi:hypothetical protein
VALIIDALHFQNNHEPVKEMFLYFLKGLSIAKKQ